MKEGRKERRGREKEKKVIPRQIATWTAWANNEMEEAMEIQNLAQVKTKTLLNQRV